MPFHKFPQLPKELRLQIIEEAIELFARRHRNYRRDIGVHPLASVDLEWNQVIERKLFSTIQLNVEELGDFSNICSKRHALLSQVRFFLLMRSDSVASPISEQQRVMGVLARVFHIMKDWMPDTERGQRGLIGLEFLFYNSLTTFSPVPLDVQNFPEVQIIGAFSEQLCMGGHFQLRHPTLNTLLAKLPNLYSARLPLQDTTEVSISALDALHATKPDLRNLDIVFDGENDEHMHLLSPSNLATTTENLAPLISRWNDSLESLSLTHAVHTAHFLQRAGDVTWLKLKELTLSGLLDWPEVEDLEPGEVLAKISDSCNELVTGLVPALRTMPHMRTIRICLSTAEPSYTGFTLSMDLGRSSHSSGHIFRRHKFGPDHVHAPELYQANQLNKDPVKLCSDRLLPPSASAVALVETISCQDPIDLDENIVAELKDTVRKYRQMELAVFNCSGFGVNRRGCWRDNDIPCTQWNAQTGTWDPAFWNDMDVFMYQMGKYWEWQTRKDELGIW